MVRPLISARTLGTLAALARRVEQTPVYIRRYTPVAGRAGMQDAWAPVTADPADTFLGWTVPLRGEALTRAGLTAGQVQDKVFYALYYPPTVGDTPATADPATGAWLGPRDKVVVADVTYDILSLDPPGTYGVERQALIWRKI